MKHQKKKKLQNKKLLIVFIILILIIIIGITTMVMSSKKPKTNKSQDISEDVKIRVITLSDNVPNFEASNSYQFNLPENYKVSELKPAGTDFLIGVSYVECINKIGITPTEETCDISISSMPEKILDGSLEDDIKKAGNVVVEYKKINFVGENGYEVLFKLPGFSGYKITFLHNKRVYSITAPLNSRIKNINDAKTKLSAIQKMIIETFKFESKENLWSNLNETTWKKENKWAGESYVFYEDFKGDKRCIHQIHGSGVYITDREYVKIAILDNKKIKIDNTTYEYKNNTLISNKEILSLESRTPLVYNRKGLIDMKIVKSDNFNISDISH